MNGVGKNQFDPMGQTTRAMLVSILYRMAGEQIGRASCRERV